MNLKQDDMGVASDIFGIGGLADGITSIVGKFVPDKTQALLAQTEITQAILSGASAVDEQQAQTNTAEASSRNVFVMGWRPFIGWVCGAAFSWQFIFQPIFTFFYVLWTGKAPQLPTLDNSELTTVLLGMLGLGAMHVYENVQTTNSK